MKKTLICTSLATVLLLGAIATVNAAGLPAAPPSGELGAIVINPYKNSPLTAVVNLHNKEISDVTVTVHGKGKNGVPISYPVGPQTLLRHDGVPIFGLYANHRNNITLNFNLDGKKITEEHQIVTGGIESKYLDHRNHYAIPAVNVTKVDRKFADRLYLVNSNSSTAHGSDLNWVGPKPPPKSTADILAAQKAMGAIPFDAAPLNIIVDTEGEIRWWLNQDATYEGHDIDLNKRGIMMGINETQDGMFTFVQGQRYGFFDLMGRIDDYRLPRGYADATHAMWPMENGNFLVRASKQNYYNQWEDTYVHTVRDHILEVDARGNLLDVWDLNKILDPYRESLLVGLDMGAVCLNIDADAAGMTIGAAELDAPYGDIPGVGPGRNWAHVNSISHDPSDDSIILSLRHQGNVKIGRDKDVKWIIAPREGWNNELAKKLLTPVDSKGKKIKCNDKGKCEGDFDFTYTQHTTWLSPKGTITSLDNGDGRWNDQPVMPTDKWTRFVEYKVDEENMTVEQLWEYGKERGWEWYSPVTSNAEYRADRDTMFGFGGSIDMFDPSTPTIGRINEIDYKTKEVMVEIDVMTLKPLDGHYRSVIVTPKTLFGK
ncbi:aryl-sulfate sulfotransferase [Ferrimonas pelagia]|uniref:Aryl-sulfate sulfotransferase n=1 Tax=Ferrimonas pelagia TaxID=1177826 RepID=A0ABP9EK71_9GAMM